VAGERGVSRCASVTGWNPQAQMMSSWAKRGSRRRHFLPEYRSVEAEGGRGEGIKLCLCDRLESPGADDE